MLKNNVIHSLWVCLSVLILMTGCQSTKTIVNGLDERDANEIIVLLDQHNITAYKLQQKQAMGGRGAKTVLWDIAVGADDASRALEVLNENGLPRVKSQDLIQLFSNSGLVPSEVQETVRYRAGLANNIANMIRQIDGVIDAEVQLSFPHEDPLTPNAKLPPITASVYVKHTGVIDDPNSHLISKIKELVSGAVAGLSLNNVTVIPDKARIAISESTMSNLRAPTYHKVFGFIIAKNSVKSFERLIDSLSVFIFILILSFIWLSWKIYPLLKRRGGITQLFHMTPLEETIKRPVEENQEENSKPSD